MTWALAATIGVVLLAIPFLPVYLNADSICHGQPFWTGFRCESQGLALGAGAALGVGAIVVPSDRWRFILLCLLPFVLAPDWTWVYYLLPMMAALVLLEPGERDNVANDRVYERLPAASMSPSR